MRIRGAGLWIAIVAAGLTYPVVVLAVGGARFPNRSECVHPARSDGDLEVVFGRFESLSDASTALTRVLAGGFKGSQIEPDGCGLFKVDVQGISTLRVGGEVLAEAHSVGLNPSLEIVTS